MISLKSTQSSLTKKRDQGFTIVELLIVIVVIGILAALVITTYSGIQAKARNSKRQSDLQAVQTQIEAYYTSNGYYPTAANLASASWDSSNLKSLDQVALHDPSASGTAITLGTGAPSVGTYQYAPLATGGGSCDNAATATYCATYTLSAQLESGGGTYTKTNLD